VIRFLIAKIGLDGHDIGIRLISTLLREAGVEIIYLGTYQTPESVVISAIQEAADIIGLSFLGGDHLEHVSKVQRLLKSKELKIPVIVGGVIPRQDIRALKEMGVREVFERGSPFRKIQNCITSIYGDKP
jgi:methylmalonyl-CoA mutase C-terminal domain/subunit